MKKFYLIGFFFLVSCVHVETPSVRTVSSSPLSEKVEILDPLKFNGFVKLNISNSEDLGMLKKVLEDTLTNEDSLSAAQKLNSDYFKSVKWAIKLTSQLIDKNLNSAELGATESFSDLINIIHALRNRFVNPFETKVELLALPFLAAKYTYSPEIQIPQNRVDSPEIAALTGKESANELTRTHLLDSSQIICDYDKPKDGWGYKPGFKIKCGSRKLKIKFGNEILSGPFNTRIFRVLGYPTPKIDLISDFRMKYNRRYITEFNSQKQVNIDIKLLGAKIKTITTKRAHDPFSFIKNATLKDSTILSSAEFRKALIQQEQYNENFEDQIDFLTFNDATVTENLDVIDVGPWSFEEPNHQKNPIVHQGIIISAWVGNSDIHMANNALILEKSDDKKTALVRPIFVDVGYGLGRTDSALKPSSSDVEKMNWTISEVVTPNADQNLENQKVILSGYTSQQYNSLLTRLKFDDVYGALKNICRLSASHIKEAFLQSGATEAVATLGTAKLLHRRSKLIADFGIQTQFKACYEPQKK